MNKKKTGQQNIQKNLYAQLKNNKQEERYTPEVFVHFFASQPNSNKDKIAKFLISFCFYSAAAAIHFE